MLSGAAHITTPKTSAALRTIILFPESIAALKAHKATQNVERLQAGASWRNLDLIFATPTGSPLNPKNVFRNLAVIERKANDPQDGAFVPPDAVLPRFDIHDLRYTRATHLLQAGWSIRTVSRRLGHANPGITMTIYAHALSDTQDEANTTPATFAFPGGPPDFFRPRGVPISTRDEETALLREAIFLAISGEKWSGRWNSNPRRPVWKDEQGVFACLRLQSVRPVSRDIARINIRVCPVTSLGYVSSVKQSVK